jgi:ribonuclease P protein subunit POP4
VAITPQNILAHEWIGLKVTIEKSTDPRVRGLSGLVRDETRNTFTIQTRDRILRVTKLDTIFKTTLSHGESLTVNGRALRYRPEDRVKKGLNRW